MIPTGKPEEINIIRLPYKFLSMMSPEDAVLTLNMSKRRNNIRPVLGLKLGKSRVIRDAQQDLSHVKWLANVRVHKRQQVLDWVPRCYWFKQLNRLPWCPYLQRTHPLSGFSDRVESKIPY